MCRCSSLDVLDLVSTDGDFLCERCDTILETVGDNKAIKSEKFSELLENVKVLIGIIDSIFLCTIFIITIIER